MKCCGQFSLGQEANADYEGRGEGVGGDMIKFGTTEDESSSMVLNFLEFLNEVFWRTSKQSITLIQTWDNKTTEKGFSGIIRLKMTNRGTAANLQVAQTVDIINMLAGREGLVKCHTKTANRRGYRDLAAIEIDWRRQGQNGLWGTDYNHFTLTFIRFRFIYTFSVIFDRKGRFETGL